MFLLLAAITRADLKMSRRCRVCRSTHHVCPPPLTPPTCVSCLPHTSSTGPSLETSIPQTLTWHSLIQLMQWRATQRRTNSSRCPSMAPSRCHRHRRRQLPCQRQRRQNNIVHSTKSGFTGYDTVGRLCYCVLCLIYRIYMYLCT